MDTLEKAELSPLMCHIVRFSKSGIPIYISEVPDKAGRKTTRKRRKRRRRRRRTQAIAINAIKLAGIMSYIERVVVSKVKFLHENLFTEENLVALISCKEMLMEKTKKTLELLEAIRDSIEDDNEYQEEVTKSLDFEVCEGKQ